MGHRRLQVLADFPVTAPLRVGRRELRPREPCTCLLQEVLLSHTLRVHIVPCRPAARQTLLQEASHTNLLQMRDAILALRLELLQGAGKNATQDRLVGLGTINLGNVLKDLFSTSGWLVRMFQVGAPQIGAGKPKAQQPAVATVHLKFNTQDDVLQRSMELLLAALEPQAPRLWRAALDAACGARFFSHAALTGGLEEWVCGDAHDFKLASRLVCRPLLSLEVLLSPSFFPSGKGDWFAEEGGTKVAPRLAAERCARGTPLLLFFRDRLVYRAQMY